MNTGILTIKCFSASRWITKIIIAAGIASLFYKDFEWSIAMFLIALAYGFISSYLHKEFIKSNE